MAVQTKTIDDYKGFTGGIDWKTMGGGAGGSTGSGLGNAIVGALAAGALAAGTIASGRPTENTTTGTINEGILKNETNKAEAEKPIEPEPEKEPVIAPDIEDKTNENLEKTINSSGLDNALKWAEEQQKAQWEREDTIRKETQEREDTAYQRAVADMRAAGINPNLVGVDPAASGGGITSATGQNMQMYQAEMNKYMQELDQMFQENFKGDENAKDRFMELISSIINLYGIIKK